MNHKIDLKFNEYRSSVDPIEDKLFTDLKDVKDFREGLSLLEKYWIVVRFLQPHHINRHLDMLEHIILDLKYRSNTNKIARIQSLLSNN